MWDISFSLESENVSNSGRFKSTDECNNEKKNYNLNTYYLQLLQLIHSCQYSNVVRFFVANPGK